MNEARPTPVGTRLLLASLALASALSVAACGTEPEDTAPLSESAKERIIRTEPVEDHEPGQTPDAINDPTDQDPPLINRTGPDRDEAIEVPILPENADN